MTIISTWGEVGLLTHLHLGQGWFSRPEAVFRRFKCDSLSADTGLSSAERPTL